MSYTLEDTAALRRQAEAMRAEMIAESWDTAGTFFLHAVVWIGRTFWNAMRLLSSAIAARQAYRNLSGLSDQQLSELGLTVEEVPSYIAAILNDERAPVRSTAASLRAVDGRRPANEQSDREAPHLQAA